jgi:hypothetical protein
VRRDMAQPALEGLIQQPISFVNDLLCQLLGAREVQSNRVRDTHEETEVLQGEVRCRVDVIYQSSWSSYQDVDA